MFYTRKVKESDQGTTQGGAAWTEDAISEETLMEVGDSVYLTALRHKRTPEEAAEIAQASMLDALEWAIRARSGLDEGDVRAVVLNPTAWGMAYADRFLASEHRRRAVFMEKVLPLMSGAVSESSTVSYWSREWAEVVMQVVIDRLESISMGDLCPPVPGGVVLTRVEVAALRALAAGDEPTLSGALERVGGTHKGRALATQRGRIAQALQEIGMFNHAGKDGDK